LGADRDCGREPANAVVGRQRNSDGSIAGSRGAGDKGLDGTLELGAPGTATRCRYGDLRLPALGRKASSCCEGVGATGGSLRNGEGLTAGQDTAGSCACRVIRRQRSADDIGRHPQLAGRYGDPGWIGGRNSAGRRIRSGLPRRDPPRRTPNKRSTRAAPCLTCSAWRQSRPMSQILPRIGSRATRGQPRLPWGDCSDGRADRG